MPRILLTCLTIAFSFFTMEGAFSQDRKQTTGSAPAQTDGTSSYVTGLTAGRARSLVGVAVGLISVIIGWRAKARSDFGNSRPQVIAAVLGVTAIILSVVHLANTTGGFGTGGGKAGAIVALALGVAGTALNVLRLRSKRGSS
jgi:hypothetical protein